MRFPAAPLLLRVLLGIAMVGVQAVDNRLLYTIPAKDSIDAFRAAFESTCANGTWTRAHHALRGLSFRGFIFQPGDYAGKHADTEARLVCSWYNASAPDPAPSVTFTTEVAAYLGATKT
ncbi:hypothetical protein B0H17DRAFT_1050292 [Mycena rosella]|uniref:Uncharacterized protein n=1 Tax=Mycena rosella TaxID=1033263 RepID=A0AAD7DSY0_MYCRO|nr:hypothetical protein B0H17DRAFT_1050292 [Mycena rosella]